MPATDGRASRYSHDPPSRYLVSRAFRTRSARRCVARRWRTLKEQAWNLVPLARADAHQTVPERCGGGRSAPAEFRSDVLEDAFEHVGVVVHTQLVRDREEQRVGCLDGLVAREFFHQYVGFRGVRPPEDGPRVRVDVADLVPVAGVSAKVRAVAIVDERENAAADRHARLTLVPGVLPRLTIGVNLLALLYVERLARLIIFERRTLEIHAQLPGPLGCRVGTRPPPDSLAQSF